MAVAPQSTRPLPPPRLESGRLAQARPSTAPSCGDARGAGVDDGVQRTCRLAAPARVGGSWRRGLCGGDSIRLPSVARTRAVALRRNAGDAARRAHLRPDHAWRTAVAVRRRFPAAAI